MAIVNGICVIIPVHKAEIHLSETVSLLACKKHLSKYDTFLVFPEGMDTKAYCEVHNGLILKPVNPDWMSSVEKYNKMKLSIDFYKMFIKYKYMLTYELDAYIFHSDLSTSNALLFDFIGAPFFEGYWAASAGSSLIKGCNSGFSIRNIQSCLHVLTGMKKYRLHWFLYKIFLSRLRPLRLKINEITKQKYEVFLTGRFAFHFADFHINEDIVWSEIIPQLFPTFIVADPLNALKFSFEYNLDESLALNNGELPLGCHAWYKHLDFWRRYIDAENRL